MRPDLIIDAFPLRGCELLERPVVVRHGTPHLRRAYNKCVGVISCAVPGWNFGEAPGSG